MAPHASSPSPSPAGLSDDIEELHRRACDDVSTTYLDPITGFQVFTEIAHLRRGKCCGNRCRHCPYGWTNVEGGGDANNRRDAKVESGDVEACRNLLAEYQNRKLSNNSDSNGSAESVESSSAAAAAAAAVAGGSASTPAPTDRTGTDAAGADSGASSAGGGKNGNNGGGGGSGSSKKTGGRRGGRLTGKNVPYTRGGDKGTSQLLTGERRSKCDDAFEAMGTVDELCSFVGVVHATWEIDAAKDDAEAPGTAAAAATSPENGNSMAPISDEEFTECLLDIMSRLFDIGSHVAKPRKLESGDGGSDGEEASPPSFEADGVGGGFDSRHVDELEDWVDRLTEELPELGNFILPTGSPVSAHLHVCRTVCRRAERRVVSLTERGVCDPNALRYLNRLSDFFFSAARWTNLRQGHAEVQYQRPRRGARQRGRVVVPLAPK